MNLKTIGAFLPLLFISAVSFFTVSCQASKELQKAHNFEMVVAVDMRDVMDKVLLHKYFVRYNTHHSLAVADSVSKLYPDSSYLRIFITELKKISPEPLAHTFDRHFDRSETDASVIERLSQEVNAAIDGQEFAIERRLKKDSVESLIIERIRSTNRIRVSAYTDKSQRLERLISEQGKLYLYELHSKDSTRFIVNHLAGIDLAGYEKAKHILKDYLKNKDAEWGVMAATGDTAVVNRFLSTAYTQSFLPADISHYWSPGDSTLTELLLVYNEKSSESHWISGAHIDGAALYNSADKGYGVELKLNSQGIVQWRRLISEYNDSPSVKRHVAVIVDDKCYAVLPLKEGTNKTAVLINAKFTLAQADELKALIDAGSLPFKNIVLAK